MNRTKKLIVMLVVFLILFGGYTLLAHKNAEKKAAEKEAEASIPVSTVTADSISQISWNYNGESISLIRSEDTWTYADDPAFPLDQTFPKTMLSAVTGLLSSRTLDEITDLSEYGLDDPTLRVTITTSDGSKKEYLLGNQNEMTEEYYLKQGDADTVYMVDDTLKSAFSHGLNDIIAMEEIPVISNIKSFKIETGEQTTALINMEDSSDISYTDKYVWFLRTLNRDKEIMTALDTDKVTMLQKEITGLKWVNCVEYSATEEKLSEFGLDKPAAKVSIDYTENVTVDTDKADDAGNAIKEDHEYTHTFTLLIGNSDGAYDYAMLPDSKMVYQINASVADALTTASYSTLRPDNVCLMNWETVEALDITTNGSNTTIVFNRTETTDEKGNVEKTSSYTVNGAEGDADLVQAFLDSITSLKAESDTETVPEDLEAEITIVFHRNTDTFRELTLTLSPYDNTYDLAGFNGETRLLVNKTNVASLKTAFEAIMK